MVEPDKISVRLARQRDFFATGATRDIRARKRWLEGLRNALQKYRGDIIASLSRDMGKPELEAFAAEIAIVNQEIDLFSRRIGHWAEPKKVRAPLFLRPARSYQLPEPLGQVLIMSPWNYPFNLALMPLVGAIGAGNCVTVKPSEVAPGASRVLTEILEHAFSEPVVVAVEGGAAVAERLLERPWDHIFFTGGTEIGRIVLRRAAEHLTPVTLELGGKSPAVVDESCSVVAAARSIAFGKFFNAGQSCVAPDYVLAHERVKEQLVVALRQTLLDFYGVAPKTSPDFARIISDRHFQRLMALLKDGRVLAGGESDASERYIAPTLLDSVALDSPLMSEEIFGPLLPIVPYNRLDEAIAIVQSRPRPLALYVFTGYRSVQREVLSRIPFGGGCVNDTVVHFSVSGLPFGGVGTSGMGAYHGFQSFRTFSHFKSIVERSPRWDVTRLFRFPPYDEWKQRLLRWYFS